MINIKELALQSGLSESELISLDLEKILEKFAQSMIIKVEEILNTRKNIAIDDEWNLDEAFSAGIFDIQDYFDYFGME